MSPYTGNRKWKGEVGLCCLTGFFLLLAALCLAVYPGVRFSGYLSLCLAGLCLVFLAVGRWAESSRTGGIVRRVLLILLAAGLLLPYLLTSIVRIHSWPLGRRYVFIPFILAFLSDTGAYFAGRAFGKHKLAPVISPHKTVEGVVGGVLGATLGMLIFCLVMQLGFKMQVNYLYAVLYGVVGSLGAVFGDLCFSVIKRQTGIKDYGNLIPGHGGVLDRFDSLTLVAPAMEVLLVLLPMAV